MPTTEPPPAWRLPKLRVGRIVLAGLAFLVVLALLIPPLASWYAAGRLRGLAASRNLDVHWASLTVNLLARCHVRNLTVTTATGDTAVAAREIEVGIAPWSLVMGRPRLSGIVVRDGRLRAGLARRTDPDTLAPEPPSSDREALRRVRAERLQRSVDDLARLLLAPARRLPPVLIERVRIEAGATEDAIVRAVELDHLDLSHARGRTALTLSGTVEAERRVGFQGALAYDREDRLAGSATLAFPTRVAQAETLSLALDGVVHQDRGSGRIVMGEGTRLDVGTIPILLNGSIARAGPRIALEVRADSLTQGRIAASVPEIMLGRLSDVAVRGSFDYRLRLDLDFDRPEAMELEAKVIPHGLRLDPAGTRLSLLGLDAPFTATIHLPRERVVRELSPANPHFRPLVAIDSVLVWSVVTNEDGGFYRHRGFNLDAVKSSVAENIRAGAYRRGAGTITMQLARNLYLGHERTISRKIQEVVLAWILEHLTGVSKHRLLEIYLNIIEWGPGVHGADEAAHFYFGHGAGKVTTAEALFLATVIPAPRKWKWRVDEAGALRHYAREQMHFIGRAMIGKEVLSPGSLPPKDSLHVTFAGRAHEILFPPVAADSSATAPVDTTATQATPP